MNAFIKYIALALCLTFCLLVDGNFLEDPVNICKTYTRTPRPLPENKVQTVFMVDSSGGTNPIDEVQNKQIQDLAQCSGGVIVGRSCFRLPYRVGSRLNFEDAEELCSFQGSRLAEIPTREVYDAVYNYIKTTWSVELEAPNALHIGIWFGMQYQNGMARLRDGSTAYISWHSAYPKSGSTNSKMGMQAPTRLNGPEQGMWNLPTTHTAVPLCEFTLE